MEPPRRPSTLFLTIKSEATINIYAVIVHVWSITLVYAKHGVVGSYVSARLTSYKTAIVSFFLSCIPTTNAGEFWLHHGLEHCWHCCRCPCSCPVCPVALVGACFPVLLEGHLPSLVKCLLKSFVHLHVICCLSFKL